MTFTRRSKFTWELRTRSLEMGSRTLVMGVLNVTPDSFSDGGQFLHVSTAVPQGLRMLDEGADILDIGGESTRPGQKEVLSAEEEQARVLPVIEGIRRARPDVIISVDTYKAATAIAAVRAGAEIINDVSGLLWDAEMAAACARLECGVVLMHTRGRPDQWKSQPPLKPEEVLPLVRNELRERLEDARKAGIAREKIVLDPGYGFGKRLDENYPLLANQSELLELDQPLLVGVSRKSFLAHALKPLYQGKDAPIAARLHATIAATTAAILAGASVVRVHDVRPVVEAAHIADAILQGDVRH
ncbi:MAG TPA: dihydropteroate synthase [Pseudacidobacterium sp.]|nr:dihydropteroate synthase [Pseudacidobacterium sp.]